MAHLNISFKEAEKIADSPSYSSLVSKNRYSPLISSNAEFPELTYKNHNNNSNNNHKLVSKNHNKPNLENNPTKKRRIINEQHSPVQINREYEWSFGSPLESYNSRTFEDVKSLLVRELTKHVNNALKLGDINNPDVRNMFYNQEFHDIIDMFNALINFNDNHGA